MADYVTFGFLFGDKTLATQVRLLPAASALTYCWNDRSCTLERYRHLDQMFQRWEGNKLTYFEELSSGFQRRRAAGNLGGL